MYHREKCPSLHPMEWGWWVGRWGRWGGEGGRGGGGGEVRGKGRKEEEEEVRREGKLAKKKEKINTSHPYKVQTPNDIISTLYSLI